MSKKKKMHNRIVLTTVAIATILTFVGAMGLDGDGYKICSFALFAGLIWQCIFVYANRSRYVSL